MKKKFSNNSSCKVIRLTDSPEVKLTFDTYYSWEKRNFDMIDLPDDKYLKEIILNNDEIDAIVIQYAGDTPEFKNLNSLPQYYLRKSYVYDTESDHGIEFALSLNKRILSKYGDPLFSIVTPLYNTNLRYFEDAYKSLANQSLNDWEWVLIDDSSKPLKEIKKHIDELKDVRLKYYRIGPTNGNIGMSKWRGFSLSRGKWLIEFDHDDMLMWWCLQTIKEAIDAYPENRFVYSDNTTIDKDNKVTPCNYGKDYEWGLGYGYSYASPTPSADKHTVRTDSSGPMTNATIRHIVGVPNHFRCWERNFYFGIGGHNQDMRIADDYELLVRSFLHTKFTHIKVCCYAQRFDGNNSQYKKEYDDGDGQGNINDIQRRVRLASIYYDTAIHNRLEELGLDDSKWVQGDPYETAQIYQRIRSKEICEDIYLPEWAKNNSEDK